MSRMLSKMNLISVVQQLPKEDIETIQGYVEMIEQENQELQQRIDKAIEYIENNKLYHYEYDDEELFEIVVSNKKELLDILKGSGINDNRS